MSRPYDANDYTGATGNWGGHRENPPPYCPKQFQDAKTKRRWVDNVLCHRVSCGEEMQKQCVADTKSGVFDIAPEAVEEQPGGKHYVPMSKRAAMVRVRVRK
jgi:hypothetical protein